MIFSMLYDKQDFIFLEQVNKIIETSQIKQDIKLPLMHPNGIVGLTTSQEMRMASAVLSLLDTLQTHNATERIRALENLHNEVLLTARTKFRYNTARVLIEIMKEIVRSYGEKETQIQLVHDFRMVAKGNPNLVRKFLKKYYLIEMPEEWNQLVFDHHVHDANTKGRKSPTHLIMDAWIKGIRSLTVIYYHFVSQEAASELIRAAHVMGIRIRIGILYNIVYRHKIVDFIWVVQENIVDEQSFFTILNQSNMMNLLEKGQKLSAWKEKYIFRVLDEWNDCIRHQFMEEFEINLENISREEFSSFVAFGQSSVLHMAELIHQKALPELTKKADKLTTQREEAHTNTERATISNLIKSLNRLTPEYFFEILEDCEHSLEEEMLEEILSTNQDRIILHATEMNEEDCKEKNINVHAATHTTENNINAHQNTQSEHVPDILFESPYSLAKQLHSISNSSTITLNLARLNPEEILNIIWDCKGLLTHLEIFNLYDWHNGDLHFTVEINELMNAINTKNTPNLKQYIQNLLHTCEEEKRQQNVPIEENRHKNLHEEEQNTFSHAFYTQQQNSLQTTAQQQTPIQTSFQERECADIERKIYTLETMNSQIEGFMGEQISIDERITKLHHILQNILTLTNYYNVQKLYTRMGTDSTSRVGRLAGMGLAYYETLPSRVRRELKKNSNDSRLLLPLRKELKEVITYRIPYANEKLTLIKKLLRATGFLRKFSLQKSVHFDDSEARTHVFNQGMCSVLKSNFSSNNGNIIALGGAGARASNAFCTETICQETQKDKHNIHTTPINTNFLNVLKILIGFIPAFLSFQYTQNIPFLAWGGALIWFVITGFRNIIQAVLGGGGFQRSPLLRWNNYVSWSRLADSLMYTGLSVVLLELLVRNLFLQDICGITSLSSPVLTFTIISLLNGCYIVAHNIVRGLQIQAILGNFFRSFFAIPLALLYNGLFTTLLLYSGVENIDIILLSSSAILSKVASDTVAGIIEGLADRGTNMWRRHWDYEISTNEMYVNYSQLELEFPEDNVLQMLAEPEKLLKILQEQNKELYRKIIINSLDFMYFYYYQPRAFSTLKNIVYNLSETERLSWLSMESVLQCKKRVSQLFVDGVINDNFATALAFYLAKHEDYLKDMQKLYNIKNN